MQDTCQATVVTVDTYKNSVCRLASSSFKTDISRVHNKAFEQSLGKKFLRLQQASKQKVSPQVQFLWESIDIRTFTLLQISYFANSTSARKGMEEPTFIAEIVNSYVEFRIS